MRARFYDSTTGRFISTDPTGLAGGTNGYEFAGNAPTVGVDPTGEILWLVLPLVGGAVGGVAGGLTYTPGQGWSWSWSGAGQGFVTGAVGTAVGLGAGVLLGTGIGAATVGGALSGGVSNGIGQIWQNGGFNNFNGWSLAASVGFGALGGAAFGKLPAGRPPGLLSSNFGVNSQRWTIREFGADFFGYSWH